MRWRSTDPGPPPSFLRPLLVFSLSLGLAACGAPPEPGAALTSPDPPGERTVEGRHEDLHIEGELLETYEHLLLAGRLALGGWMAPDNAVVEGERLAEALSSDAISQEAREHANAVLGHWESGEFDLAVEMMMEHADEPDPLQFGTGQEEWQKELLSAPLVTVLERYRSGRPYSPAEHRRGWEAGGEGP